MNAVTIFLGIWGAIGILVGIFFAFVILTSIGFKSLFAIFKAKMKMKKGYGLVLMHYRTGERKLIPTDFNKELLQPFGEQKGKFVYKPHCVFLNEYGRIPTIAYREEDAEPINPRTGLQTSTSPKVLENILAKALKAEQEYAGGFLDFLKRHWLKILMFYLGPLAILGFIALNQNDTIAALAQQGGKQVLINASNIGK